MGQQQGQYSSSDVQSAPQSGTYTAANVDQSPDESDWWNKAKKIGSAIWSSTPIGDLSDRADEIQQWADKKYKEQTDPAKTPNPDARATFGLGVLRDLAGLVHGATSPTGAAVTGATIAAPEIMGPVLVAHGGYKLATTEGGALNPDAMQQRLNAGAEMAGGAAAAGQGIAEPTPFSNAVRNSLPSRTVPTAKLNVAPPAGELQPALENTPKEVLDYASQKGIDLTPGQATQGPVSRTVEAIGERSLLGGNQLAEAKEASATAFAKNVRAIADRVDPKGLGLSEEQAGETIQQVTQLAKEVANNNASDAYKQLPQEALQEPVDVSQIRSAYFQKLKQAEVSLANRNPEVAAQIRGVLQQGANLGTPDFTENGAPFMRPELKIADLLKVRSDAIQDGGALVRQGAPSEVQGLYRGLASDVDQVVSQAMDKRGLTQQWREANAGWKDYLNKYDNAQSPLYRIQAQGDPARVTRQILTNGSAADIELMNKENMQGALEALRRQALTDIANRGFKVRGDGLGGYSDAFLNQLFGRAGTKELYLNGELARRMGFQQNPSGTSNVLLGAEQFSKEPSKFMVPMGAAKASMPRNPTKFLPQPTRQLPPPSPGALVGGATSQQ